MTKPELTPADFYTGLSDEDRAACARDVLYYGQAWARMNEDGTKTRIEPDVDHEALERIWGRS